MGSPVFPPCFLTWGHTIVEVMKITAASFKIFSVCTGTCVVPPNPAVGHSRLHWRLLDTHGLVWVSLLWGHCSILLGPAAHKVLFVPSKSLFPQTCVSSGGSMMGLMVTPSKRAHAIPRSTAPRAPAPASVHCWPVRLQETLKHSSLSVSVGSLSPGAHKVCLSPLWVSLAGMVFDSKCDFAPPTILLELLLFPWMWSISSVTVL